MINTSQLLCTGFEIGSKRRNGKSTELDTNLVGKKYHYPFNVLLPQTKYISLTMTYLLLAGLAPKVIYVGAGLQSYAIRPAQELDEFPVLNILFLPSFQPNYRH